MIFRAKQESASCIARPRITPDPEQAAKLERLMSALDYCPENGFLRDCRQTRREPFALRVAAATRFT